MQYLLIGNPENRRISGFVSALSRAGLPAPIVLAHQDLIEQPERLLQYKDQRLIVRIDSAGENAIVERLLLKQGYDDVLHSSAQSIAPAELDLRGGQHGELFCPRQYHYGYERYLTRLEMIFNEVSHWTLLNHPASIKELFDKRVTSQKYQQNGISVPDTIVTTNKDTPMHCSVLSPTELRQSITARGWSTIFIKLSCGSSASGLAVYFYNRSRTEKLVTTMRVQGGRIFNSLKMQVVTQRQKIDNLLRFLLDEGSQIEKAIPKSRLQGAFMDCRVLVIAGTPCFTVVRQSRHPVTNLHLGGWRGDLDALKKEVSTESWNSAMDSCRQVYQLHDSFQLGIDLMFEPGFKKHRILEANAFGDLLPRLSRDGKSVYEYQIDKVKQKYCQAI